MPTGNYKFESSHKIGERVQDVKIELSIYN